MPRYEKWLGAGLGWMVTGNPLGGILGYLAGSYLTSNDKTEAQKLSNGISELEVNILVLSSHLIKIDGKISPAEINFATNFLNEHFDAGLAAERSQVLHHCLNKEYDLGVACDQIRIYTKLHTRIQVVRYLLDLARSDGELNERENYFIFRVAGYMNVNDVEFRKLKSEVIEKSSNYYDLLEVSKEATIEKIRKNYRRLVLKYHPDRNKHLSEEEKKKLTEKLLAVQEAYQIAKQTLREK
jgi:DnaJ like chaperone protein